MIGMIELLMQYFRNGLVVADRKRKCLQKRMKLEIFQLIMIKAICFCRKEISNYLFNISGKSSFGLPGKIMSHFSIKSKATQHAGKLIINIKPINRRRVSFKDYRKCFCWFNRYFYGSLQDLLPSFALSGFS